MAVHCPECGFLNGEGANYCQKCGAFLGDAGNSTPTAAYRVGGTGGIEPISVDHLAAQGGRPASRAGGGRPGEAFALNGERMTIGPRPEADIFLDDVTVSRD